MTAQDIDPPEPVDLDALREYAETHLYDGVADLPWNGYDELLSACAEVESLRGRLVDTQTELAEAKDEFDSLFGAHQALGVDCRIEGERADAAEAALGRVQALCEEAMAKVRTPGRQDFSIEGFVYLVSNALGAGVPTTTSRNTRGCCPDRSTTGRASPAPSSPAEPTSLLLPAPTSRNRYSRFLCPTRASKR